MHNDTIDDSLHRLQAIVTRETGAVLGAAALDEIKGLLTATAGNDAGAGDGADGGAQAQPREVTLLPRHWDWLGQQRGGASAALRRLVEAELRRTPAPDRATAPAGRDAAYAFLSAIAGNLPGYEEAIRALYGDGGKGFAEAMAGWPDDIRAHARTLAGLA